MSKRITANVSISWNQDAVFEKYAVELNDRTRKIAEKIKSAAEKKCPVGKTGNLKKSIKLTPSKYPYGGYAISAGSDKLYYAFFVEVGTNKFEAKNYIRGSVDSSRSYAKSTFAKKI